MTFTTLTFALFFLGFFPAYWALRDRRRQNCLVLTGSYFFYGWWDWRFCGLMALTSLLDFSLAQAIQRTADEQHRRRWLLLGLTVSLGVLGYFKYFNFFAESARAAARALGGEVSWATVEVVLPVGISFYTFQSLSYLIDVYRRQITACESWVDYFAYVSFFPQLVAGPIERATSLLPQFGREREFNYASAVEGCQMILWGLVKKLVVAGHLAGLVDGVFAHPTAASGGMIAAAAIAFTLQIYCDFSAYSEIAVGLARLLGFRLMRNFVHPVFPERGRAVAALAHLFVHMVQGLRVCAARWESWVDGEACLGAAGHLRVERAVARGGVEVCAVGCAQCASHAAGNVSPRHAPDPCHGHARR